MLGQKTSRPFAMTMNLLKEVDRSLRGLSKVGTDKQRGDEEYGTGTDGETWAKKG